MGLTQLLKGQFLLILVLVGEFDLMRYCISVYPQQKEN